VTPSTRLTKSYIPYLDILHPRLQTLTPKFSIPPLASLQTFALFAAVELRERPKPEPTV